MVQYKERDETPDQLWLIKVETPPTVHAAPEVGGPEALCGRDLSVRGTKDVLNLGVVESFVRIECRHCQREAQYLMG